MGKPGFSERMCATSDPSLLAGSFSWLGGRRSMGRGMAFTVRMISEVVGA